MTGVKSIFEFHSRWENINGTVKLTRVLGTGYWILGTGYWVSWVLGTGYWVLGTGYWVLGTGYGVLEVPHIPLSDNV